MVSAHTKCWVPALPGPPSLQAAYKIGFEACRHAYCRPAGSVIALRWLSDPSIIFTLYCLKSAPIAAYTKNVFMKLLALVDRDTGLFDNRWPLFEFARNEFIDIAARLCNDSDAVSR